MSVRFYSTGIRYIHQNKKIYSLWINEVFVLENVIFKQLNIVFCTDEYLHQLNVDYLNHDTLTDIITFQYEDNPLFGEIYISLERVKDNAKDLKVGFKDELNRVIIHGVLHLCGHKDKSDNQKNKMRALETHYIQLLVV